MYIFAYIVSPTATATPTPTPSMTPGPGKLDQIAMYTLNYLTCNSTQHALLGHAYMKGPMPYTSSAEDKEDSGVALRMTHLFIALQVAAVVIVSTWV